MTRCATIISTLALLLPAAALAEPGASPPRPDLCRPAIAAAERAHGIPAHLLAAIARVESGRRDDATGHIVPWPWTINFDGQGSFYDVKAQAVAAAASMQPRVTRSIDVGCMQISLTHHPNAFPNLDAAFDPVANAEYAAGFLHRLYDKTQSWPQAVAMYHSATPELGAQYQAKVYAAWPDELNTAPPQPVIAGMSPFGLGWNRVAAPYTPPPPRVIPLSGAPAGSIQGRTLASYRAMPVRLVSRLP